MRTNAPLIPIFLVETVQIIFILSRKRIFSKQAVTEEVQAKPCPISFTFNAWQARSFKKKEGCPSLTCVTLGYSKLETLRMAIRFV